MNSIKNVFPILDFDGVIVRDLGGEHGAIVFRDLGIEASPDDFWLMYRSLGKSYAQCLELIGAKSAEEQAEWFKRIYRPAWESFVLRRGWLETAHLGRLHPGVRGMMAGFNGMGIYPPIVSNNMASYIESTLERFGIRRMFGDIIARAPGDERPAKPATCMARMALDGVETGARVVVIGDSGSDLELARNLEAEGLEASFIGTFWDPATMDRELALSARRRAFSPAETLYHFKAIARGE